jgi:translation initiation factor 3 subunit H
LLSQPGPLVCAAYSWELIETFLAYQENIKRCVCIVYDPTRSTQGTFGLKALRLTEQFMEIYKVGLHKLRSS